MDETGRHDYRPVDPRQSFPELEEGILERWRRDDVFRRSVADRAGSERFVFYEGPPTANGRPGAHHVLSRVFKDIFPRYKTMCGYSVPRKAGWDTHGLPVELEIERKLSLKTKDDIERYGIAEFNAQCRASVFEYVSEWNRLTERIGFWIDLDDPYMTLDNDYIESVWWSLKELWDRDLLYEADKIVPYCPRCGTALSSHEVALGYKDVDDPSVIVRFPLVDAASSLLIWTTTPWTLTANVAVAVNPEAEYVRALADGEEVIVAAERVEVLPAENLEVLDRFPGSALEGVRYAPPFDFYSDLGDLAHRVVPASFVTLDDGTGLVHIAPAFGEDDLAVAKEHDLPVVNPVRDDGKFSDRIAPFKDRFVKDADQEIVSVLQDAGRIVTADTFTHSYPHCWRCDTPLLYYAKSSWYIHTTRFRKHMLEENAGIGWRPEHIKEGRFGNWLAGNVDWALSRERYWGTPLPLWRCSCGSIAAIGSRDELRTRAGSVPDDLHRPYIDDVVFPCEHCGKSMSRVPEVIDAWYDSGSMPFAQWHYPFENAESFKAAFPARFIAEAIDQTRGWFYSLLALSTMLFDRCSFENVLCLGLILDSEGHKMSKSRGNVISPWSVIDRHGADALRWYYFTSQAPWSNYRFSSEAVGESVRRFLLTLWNTYGFFVTYARIDGFHPDRVSDVIPPGERPELDRWILSRLQSTIATARAALDAYDTTTAGRAIDAMVEDLSNWYVRRSRRRFWRSASDEATTADKHAAYLTLHECLVTIAKLLAPFVPFLADEIFMNLTGDRESVHLADYPEVDDRLVDADLDFDMETARTTVRLGLAARGRAKIKVRQPLAEIVVVATRRERRAVKRLERLVLDELNVKRISYVDDASELARYQVKPAFGVLGPRYGARMPELAAAIDALDATDTAAAVQADRAVSVRLGDEEVLLGPEDFVLRITPVEGYSVEREHVHAVALRLEIDAELAREGLAREVVHAVQGLRKTAGLGIEDRIQLRLTGDAAITDAIHHHADYIAGEVLASTRVFDASSVAFDSSPSEETVTVDGHRLDIALVKAV